VTTGDLPIPHAEPFLFLERAVEIREDRGLFTWTLPRHGETFGLRMFPQLVCVEAMAQAAAALNGLNADRTSARPEGGALASLDKVRFHGAPRPGDPLTIKVRIKKRFGALVMLDGEVWVHHRMVAQAEIVVRSESGS
jgi:3-hydroxymyristoyl/3-hydroxydecanoyl-(acyl carrier protein) dehydratase